MFFNLIGVWMTLCAFVKSLKCKLTFVLFTVYKVYLNFLKSA